MEAMKFLLVSAMVLSIVCLGLALFHWVRLRSSEARVTLHSEDRSAYLDLVPRASRSALGGAG